MKIFIVLLLSLLSCTLSGKNISAETSRNPEWAKPIQLEGLENLHQINEYIYRSAQPSAEGMRHIEKLGIRTVINLRAYHSDKDNIRNTRMSLTEHEIKTWDIGDEDVISIMKLLKQKEKGPFLIHCQHGADRTGLMSAMYRIVFQEWSREKAIDELKNGGYGFHPVWTNIIDYIRKADAEKIRNAIR